jgi:hypothetical protein
VSVSIGRWSPLFIAIAIVGAIAITSCKQGLGERCQVDDDCESNKCNQAEHICATGGEGGGIDALPPIDAPAVDATDAPVDMPVDQ